MSALLKLGFSGIRCFGPDQEQRIAFTRPVTVILGTNGSGKTTIVECLKMAATGELPPMVDKGAAFVHDPRLEGALETKAKIRLLFEDSAGRTVTVNRQFQVRHSGKTKQTFSTVESSVCIRDAQGRKTKTSSRCSDVNVVVPDLMGVSRAVMDHVIFVHQEDAFWPLSDPKRVKQRFDEIFEARGYAKALTAVHKYRQQQAAELRVLHAELERHRERVQALRRRQEELAVVQLKQRELEGRYQELEQQLAVDEANLERAQADHRACQQLEAQLDRLGTEHRLREAEVAHTREQLERVWDGNDEALTLREQQLVTEVAGLEEEQRGLELSRRAGEAQRRDWEAQVTQCQLEMAAVQERIAMHERMQQEAQQLAAQLAVDYNIRVVADGEVDLAGVHAQLSAQLSASIDAGRQQSTHADAEREAAAEVLFRKREAERQAQERVERARAEQEALQQRYEEVLRCTRASRGPSGGAERGRGGASDPPDTTNDDSEAPDGTALGQHHWQALVQRTTHERRCPLCQRPFADDDELRHALPTMQDHSVVSSHGAQGACSSRSDRQNVRKPLESDANSLQPFHSGQQESVATALQRQMHDAADRLQAMQAVHRAAVTELADAEAAKRRALAESQRRTEAAREAVARRQRDRDRLESAMNSAPGAVADADHRERQRLERRLAKLESRVQMHRREWEHTDQLLRDIRWRLDTCVAELHSIRDNLRYRRMQNGLTQLESEMQQTRQQRVNPNDTAAALTQATSRVARCTAERNVLRGKLEMVGAQALDLQSALRAEAPDGDVPAAAAQYQQRLLQVRAAELAQHDLAQYQKALDLALMRYHEMKMQEINRTLRELWRAAYTGNDIDDIEIRSETEDDHLASSGGRRSHQYRVVMRRGDTVMDMRGRCSAGQKVLTCLLIRLALAESFCNQCGVLALDEPTTNLDEYHVKALAESLAALLQQRCAQRNFQLILITHEERFLEYLRIREYVDSYVLVERDHEGKTRVSQLPLDVAM